jgi:hypothetical protein
MSDRDGRSGLDEKDLRLIREGMEERPKSRIVKKDLFITVMTSGFFLFIVVYISFSSLAAVSMATSVGGAGGFLIEIEEISQSAGNELFIHPVADETSECESTIDTAGGRPNPGAGESALPLLKAQIENAEVASNTSIAFKKGIETPSLLGIDNFVISIDNKLTDANGNFVGYGPVEVGSASIVVSELSAERLELTNAKINERKSDSGATASDAGFTESSPFGPSPEYVQDPDPAKLGELVVSGEGVRLKRATGIAHVVTFTKLDFGTTFGSPAGQLNLDVKYNVNNPPTSGGATCPI